MGVQLGPEMGPGKRKVPKTQNYFDFWGETDRNSKFLFYFWGETYPNHVENLAKCRKGVSTFLHESL